MTGARRSWTMRTAGWFALLGLAAALYVVFSALSKPGDHGLRPYARGAMQKLVVAPDPPPQPQTPFRDGAGLERTLADFRGRVILVNFWATWCAPCVEEMPKLAALHDGFRGRDFAVVAISIDRADMRVRAETDLKRLSDGRLAFYQDPSAAMAYGVKAKGMPTTVLYARDGREIARLSGAADWASPEARALIEAALAR